jgi:hypothetical protein
MAMQDEVIAPEQAGDEVAVGRAVQLRDKVAPQFGNEFQRMILQHKAVVASLAMPAAAAEDLRERRRVRQVANQRLMAVARQDAFDLQERKRLDLLKRPRADPAKGAGIKKGDVRRVAAEVGWGERSCRCNRHKPA